MKLPEYLRKRLHDRLVAVALSRDPDFVIGENYLSRWYLARSGDNTKVGGVYLHRVVGDDDDRALHDHPWVNMSIILSGSYWEHTVDDVKLRRSGDVVVRPAKTLHRLAVNEGPVWSLFVFGPKFRTWGFQCPKGWVPWNEFVDPKNPGMPGPGCGD